MVRCITRSPENLFVLSTMAALKEVSIDAAKASLISDLQSISSLKEERRMSLKAFCDGKYVFALL